MTKPADIYQEGQDEVEEIALSTLCMGEDPCSATMSSNESAIALGTQTPLSAWPWAGSTSMGYTMNIPYTSMSRGLTNAQSENPTNIGSWPYPAIPNTGYNMVPFGALPYGDYSMPLGDYLTPATK